MPFFVMAYYNKEEKLPVVEVVEVVVVVVVVAAVVSAAFSRARLSFLTLNAGGLHRPYKSYEVKPTVLNKRDHVTEFS